MTDEEYYDSRIKHWTEQAGLISLSRGPVVFNKEIIRLSQRELEQRQQKRTLIKHVQLLRKHFSSFTTSDWGDLDISLDGSHDKDRLIADMQKIKHSLEQAIAELQADSSTP